MCLVATESLANMQYLNINHSDIASTIYAGMASSYLPNWIASFNTLDKGSIIFNWGIFETDQISALFLDNFGDALTELMIYLGLFLLALLFKLFSKIKKRLHSFARKVYVTTFSFFMANILGKVQSQVLFALVQIVKLNLFFDTYSRLSLITGIATISILIGVLTYCFFQVLSVFKNRKASKNAVSRKNHDQCIWLEKKYEFMIGDFKDWNKNQFFFAYWMTAFNAIYILLILCLQSAPVLQCLSIVVLIIAFLLFPFIVNPFKTKSSAFSHYFNFSCILAAAVLNLSVAITNTVNPDFSKREELGWAIVSVIGINTATNTLFSIGGMIYEIVMKIRLSRSKQMKKPSKLNRLQLEVGSAPIQSNQTQPPTRVKKLLTALKSSTEVGLNISGTDLLNESNIPVRNGSIRLNNFLTTGGSSSKFTIQNSTTLS